MHFPSPTIFIADVAKKSVGSCRIVWSGVVWSGFGQLARHGGMSIWTYWRHHWRIYRNEKARERLDSVRRLDLERTKLGVRGVRRKEIGAVNCASAEPEQAKQVHIRNSKMAMPEER